MSSGSRRQEDDGDARSEVVEDRPIALIPRAISWSSSGCRLNMGPRWSTSPRQIFPDRPSSPYARRSGRTVDITLKPVRLVRARVIETPEDRPDQSLQWDVFTVDPKAGNLDESPAIGGKGAIWVADSAEEPDLPGRRMPIGGSRPAYQPAITRSDSIPTRSVALRILLFLRETVRSTSRTSTWRLWPGPRCSASRLPRLMRLI